MDSDDCLIGHVVKQLFLGGDGESWTASDGHHQHPPASVFELGGLPGNADSSCSLAVLISPKPCDEEIWYECKQGSSTADDPEQTEGYEVHTVALEDLVETLTSVAEVVDVNEASLAPQGRSSAESPGGLSGRADPIVAPIPANVKDIAEVKVDTPSDQQPAKTGSQRLHRITDSVSRPYLNSPLEMADTSIVIEPSRDGLPAIILNCMPELHHDDRPRQHRTLGRRSYKRRESPPPSGFKLPFDSLFGSVAERGPRGGRKSSGALSSSAEGASEFGLLQPADRRYRKSQPARPRLRDTPFGREAHTMPTRMRDHMLAPSTTFEHDLTMAFLEGRLERERAKGQEKVASDHVLDEGSGRWSWTGTWKKGLKKVRTAMFAYP
jgi:hypothetical protein